MGEQYGLVVKLAMDNSNFSGKIKDVNRDLKAADARFAASSSAMGKNGSVTQTLGVKYQQLSTKMQANERAVGLYKTRLTELRTSLTQTASKQTEYGAKVEASKAKVQAMTTTLNATKAKYAEVAATQGKSSDAAKQLATSIDGQNKELKEANSELQKNEKAYSNNESKIRNISGSIKGYETSMHRATAETNNLRTEMDIVARQNSDRFLDGFISGADTASDRLDALSNKMSTMGSTLTNRVTMPIVAGAAAAAKAYSDFDSELRNAIILSDKNGQGVEVFNQALHDSGEKSKEWAQQYGVATSDINNGIMELIKKGYSFDQTLGAMPAILDATVASGDDFTTVMSVSTSVLETFGLKVADGNQTMENTARVADVVTKAANDTAAGFADLGEAMKNVGPAAVASNQDIEDMAAALGVLSNQGIEGGQAGTYLMNALRNLQTPTKRQKEAIDELGLSVFDAEGNMKKFPDILKQIEDKTGGMTMETKNMTLAQLFNTQALKGINPLLNAGTDELVHLSDATKNSSGETAKMADEMGKSSKNQIARFKSSLNVLGIQVGEHLLPHITKAMTKIGKWVKSFGELDKSTQKTILKTVALVAAIGPILKIGAPLVKGMSLAFKGLRNIALGIKALKNGYGILTTTKAMLGLVDAGGRANIMALNGARNGGSLARVLPSLAGGATASASSIASLGAAGTTASAGLTGVGTAAATGLGAVVAPAAIAVGAVVAVGAVAYGVHKKMEKDKEKERETLKKAGDDYGIFAEKGVSSYKQVEDATGQLVTVQDTAYTEVDKKTKEIVGSYSTMALNAIAEMENWSLKEGTITAEQRTKMIETYDQMFTSAKEKSDGFYNEKIAKIRESNAESLGLTQADKDAVIAELEKKRDGATTVQQQQTDQIKAIYNKASFENRALTQEEKTQIQEITERMNRNVVSNTSASADQQKSILNRLKTETGKISEEQGDKVAKEANKQYNATVKEAEKEYKERMKFAKETRSAGGIEAEKMANKIEAEAKRQKEKAVEQAGMQQLGIIKKLKEGNPGIKTSIDSQSQIIRGGWDNAMESVKSAWSSVWSWISSGNNRAKRNQPKPKSYGSSDFIGPMPSYAVGTQYHPGGVARINEQGGEIVNLPRGAQVIPHDASVKAIENVMKEKGMFGGGERPQITQYIQVGSEVPMNYIDQMTERISKNLNAYEVKQQIDRNGYSPFA